MPHGVQREEAVVVVVRTTTDEAVSTREIATGAGDLEPQGIQFFQLDLGDVSTVLIHSNDLFQVGRGVS